MATSSGSGALRIGDAERMAAVSALGDHFAAGRLDQVEFDERTTRAYAARTHADLEPLFADLPEPRPAAPAANPRWPQGWPPPRPEDRSDGRRHPLARAAWMAPAVPLPALLLGVLVLLAVVAAVARLAPFVLIPVFWFLVAGGGWRWRRYHGRRWR